MKTITLTTCNNSIEANLLKGKLESNGIRCFLVNENFSNLMPHYNGILSTGIDIIIDDEDLEKASKLIMPEVSEKQVICPNCHSTNIKSSFGSNKVLKMMTIFISLLIWVPFGNIKKMYVCKDCKTEFDQ
ncbi:MAG TPA: DUF2007 domain-containing protein [Mariniphaga sp.]|nr:DUF2007 domain-containing protein [Mariniphaga sp.]